MPVGLPCCVLPSPAPYTAYPIALAGCHAPPHTDPLLPLVNALPDRTMCGSRWTLPSPTLAPTFTVGTLPCRTQPLPCLPRILPLLRHAPHFPPPPHHSPSCPMPVLYYHCAFPLLPQFPCFCRTPPALPMNPSSSHYLPPVAVFTAPYAMDSSASALPNLPHTPPTPRGSATACLALRLDLPAQVILLLPSIIMPCFHACPSNPPWFLTLLCMCIYILYAIYTVDLPVLPACMDCWRRARPIDYYLFLTLPPCLCLPPYGNPYPP